jgi:hypothetical protein
MVESEPEKTVKNNYETASMNLKKSMEFTSGDKKYESLLTIIRHLKAQN